MRGRKPESLTIPPSDVIELERVAHRDTSPWYQVRRARILLGIASGQRQEDLACQLGCDASTVWGPANGIGTWGWTVCLPITGKATPDAT
jgi:hypothetical protein